MSSTRVRRRVNAPRASVYRALLDARAVATWMVPNGMTSHVHAFDAREGGSFRISLTYDAPTGTGKTTAQTDTYHGRFVKLETNEQVVEVVEFETTDPALRGEMTITIASPMQTAAPMSSPCTTGYRRGCRPPATRPAGGRHSRSSRRSSRRPRCWVMTRLRIDLRVPWRTRASRWRDPTARRATSRLPIGAPLC